MSFSLKMSDMASCFTSGFLCQLMQLKLLCAFSVECWCSGGLELKLWFTKFPNF